MADIAARFEASHHRAVAYMTAELRGLATRLGGVRQKLELADTKFSLDARRLADAGLPPQGGFERTVALMLRCGLR